MTTNPPPPDDLVDRLREIAALHDRIEVAQVVPDYPSERELLREAADALVALQAHRDALAQAATMLLDCVRNQCSFIPIIGATSEGGVVDVGADGRKVTFNLSAKNALPMREIMTAKQPVPYLLAALQLVVLAEIDGRGVQIKLGSGEG